MSLGRKQSYRSNKQDKLIPRDLSESLGKLPPQAVDLEEAVLGAIMLERAALIQAIDILHPEDFYLESHREIFEAIITLFRNDEPVDMRTVVHKLRQHGKLELVGGSYKVADLTSKVSSAAGIEHDARVLNEMSMKRKLIQLASKIHNDAYEDTVDVFELMDHSQKEFDAITGQYLTGHVKSYRVVYQETVKEILEGMKNKGLTGVPSGYTELDRLTAGWQKTELAILAARPGMGKTAFVVNVCRNAAVDHKIPVAIFSLEMSGLQLSMRMISAESEVDSEKVFQSRIEDNDVTIISSKTGRLAQAPIFIDDTPALSILEFRAKCRRLKAEHKIQLVVVDYLQLMRGDQSGNREQEISSISRALKAVAKDLNIPVIALSQLSRGVESRGGERRPMLSDLRESGAIEQDADKVIFLYRPEYYKISQYEDGTSTQGIMEVIIAKNRNGRCDSIKLKFIGRYSKITEIDSYSIQAPTSLLPLNPPPNFKSYKEAQVSRRELEEDDDAPF